MKLFVRIATKPFKDILTGKKTEEYRQIESIVFLCTDGQDAEYKVKRITNTPPVCVENELKKYGLEKHYDPELPAMRIFLGDKIE